MYSYIPRPRWHHAWRPYTPNTTNTPNIKPHNINPKTLNSQPPNPKPCLMNPKPETFPYEPQTLTP